MSGTSGADQRVDGERTTHGMAGLLSVQSRLSNLAALVLMLCLGAGFMGWYYFTALMRPARARALAQSAAAQQAQGESILPGLGRIEPPGGAPGLEPPLPESSVAPESVPPEASAEASAVPGTLTEIPLAQTPQGAAVGVGVQPPKTPAELAVARQLSGAVFEARGTAAATAVVADLAADPAAPLPGQISETRGPGRAAGAAYSGVNADLSNLLHPTVTAAVRAQVLPAQRLLLPKGAFIDCTLETAIDSTLPGMTTCVTATDSFGVDGTVVLLERGTKLIGETRGQVQQGAARIFVVWTEARTPAGVIVPLDSPGTDELGRSGLPGEVNRHFWQRFGAAMLVSVIDGAVQAAVQSSRNGNGAVVVNPSGSQEVLTEILKNTIDIAPTLVKRNGDRIQVLVARNLDFRSVYELRSATAR